MEAKKELSMLIGDRRKLARQETKPIWITFLSLVGFSILFCMHVYNTIPEIMGVIIIGVVCFVFCAAFLAWLAYAYQGAYNKDVKACFRIEHLKRKVFDEKQKQESPDE